MMEELTAMRLEINARAYTIDDDREMTEEGAKGTVFVYGSGPSPVVYIEDVDWT